MRKNRLVSLVLLGALMAAAGVAVVVLFTAGKTLFTSGVPQAAPPAAPPTPRPPPASR